MAGDLAGAAAPLSGTEATVWPELGVRLSSEFARLSAQLRQDVREELSQAVAGAAFDEVYRCAEEGDDDADDLGVPSEGPLPICPADAPLLKERTAGRNSIDVSEHFHAQARRSVSYLQAEDDSLDGDWRSRVVENEDLDEGAVSRVNTTKRLDLLGHREFLSQSSLRESRRGSQLGLQHRHRRHPDCRRSELRITKVLSRGNTPETHMHPWIVRAPTTYLAACPENAFSPHDLTILGLPKAGAPSKARPSAAARASGVAQVPTHALRWSEDADTFEVQDNESESSGEFVVAARTQALSKKPLFVVTAEGVRGGESGRTESMGSDMQPSRRRLPEGVARMQKFFELVVEHEVFDYVMGISIMLNAALMGAQADFSARCARTGDAPPDVLATISTVFCGIFTVELLLRVGVYGRNFLTNSDWRWNLFDLVVVGMQLGEEIISVALDTKRAIGGISFMRILRVLRLVRIIRVVRLLRFVKQLRTMVQSIACTIASLFWTVLLLLLLIYVVGICLTQIVADNTESPESISVGTHVHMYFGSLDRTVLALYQAITGGHEWRPIAEALAAQTSRGTVVVFSLYIAFALFAMLNVITGVFVEGALHSSKEEDSIDLVQRLRVMVQAMGVAENGHLTWDSSRRS